MRKLLPAILVGALWIFVIAAFAPKARPAIDATVAELGEGLLHASHGASLHIPYRMPLVPVIEALALFHLPPGAVAALAAILLASAAALCFFLGAELTGAAGGLLAAGLWALVFRGLPVGPGFHKQFVLTILLLGAAYAHIRRGRKSPVEPALWLGASLLARGTFFFLPPLLASREKKLKTAALWLIPFVFLAPWTAMNWKLLGKMQPLEHGAANMNIVTGALGTVKCAHGDTDVITGISTGYDAPLGWAAKTIAADPGTYLAGVFKRVVYTAGLKPFLVLLAMAGLIRRRRDPAFRTLAAVAAYFVLINCSMSVEENYFEPLWPLLAGLAAGLLPPAEAGARLEDFGLRVSRAVLIPFLLLAAFVSGLAVRYARTPAPSSPERLDAALIGSPDDPLLLLRRAKRLAAEGRTKESVACIERGRSGLDLPRGRLATAWLLAKDGRPAVLLENSFTAHPAPDAFNDSTGDSAPLLQALALDALNKPAEAANKLEAALSAWRGERTFLNGATEGALSEKLRSGSDGAFISRIERILEDDPPADVERALSLLIKIRPLLPEARLALRRAVARRLLAAKDVKGAEAYEKDSRDGTERLQAVRLWEDLSRFDRSAALLRAEAARRPKDAEVFIDLGVTLFRGGKFAEAAKALETAVKLDPSDPRAAESLEVARAAVRKPR